MQFILLFGLLGSLMFSASPRARFNREHSDSPAAYTQVPRTPPIPPCVDSGAGEVSCYPIDDSGKGR